MRKQYLYLIIILLLSGCNNLQLASPNEPKIRVAMSAARNLVIDRIKDFEGNIKLTVEVDRLNTTSKFISLYVEIQNISDHSIVLKKPRSTGFASTSMTYSAINDLNILLADEESNPVINVLPTSQFVLDYRMRDIIQCYLWHQLEDFVILQSGSAYKYKFDSKNPLILSEDGQLKQSLPEGWYQLSVVYRNDYIGYQEVDKEEIEKFDFLFEDTTMIYDLNAWVGEVKSNLVSIKFSE